LRPGAFARDQVHRPIYQKTAGLGHFGREDPRFTWERRNKAAGRFARPAGLPAPPMRVEGGQNRPGRALRAARRSARHRPRPAITTTCAAKRGVRYGCQRKLRGGVVGVGLLDARRPLRRPSGTSASRGLDRAQRCGEGSLLARCVRSSRGCPPSWSELARRVAAIYCSTTARRPRPSSAAARPQAPLSGRKRRARRAPVQGPLA